MHDPNVESPHPSNIWPVPRPWLSAGSSSSKGPSSIVRSKKTSIPLPYDVCLKKSIPYVTLCLDQSGRNILVDNTVNNIYIRIPEKSVSVQSILSAMATKINCEANELVILDVKFLEISDDKGKSCTQYLRELFQLVHMQTLSTGRCLAGGFTLLGNLNMRT